VSEGKKRGRGRETTRKKMLKTFKKMLKTFKMIIHTKD
jgi:hypothetical protein